MKDDCQLIQDIYPLYMENELSPPVKEMVEKHLQNCSECARIYQQGEGFTKASLLPDFEEVPGTLDDRVKMKIKFRRLKIFSVILGIIIAMMLINKYENSRQQIFSWSDTLYREASLIVDAVEATRYEGLESLKFHEKMYIDRRQTDDYSNSFNWWEQQKYRGTDHYLNLHYQVLFDTLEILHKREQNGQWDEVDTKVYSKLKEYSYQYMNEAQDEYNKFHHGYSSYLETVDIEGLEDAIVNINELAFYYNRFHQLPKDVDRLNYDQLKERISEYLHVDPSEVEFDRGNHSPYEPGLVEFYVENEFDGEIDAFTGHILRISSMNPPQLKGSLTGEKESLESVTNVLRNMYGEQAEFEIDYKGINYFSSSNEDGAKLYSYTYSLTNGGYRLLVEGQDLFVIEIDARTGNIHRLFVNQTYIHDAFFAKNFKKKLSPDVGLERLHKKVDLEDAQYSIKRRYKFTETFVIPSRMTGDYELVHAYDLENESDMEISGSSGRSPERRFINASTGFEEEKYETRY
ncbi:anti-sigma factor [Pseudalkalibacillus salsuginis]|uniref:anti-sigma factor n=1 Tax=Pseudalkalibacillus salsuginis TaxID=2910972 RepID=UPI001F205A17|nr:anti-sigma factor [Pseudalkalibacillus salsuginis]MCF6411490.1 zf-HC2 domain-containing protein [Pseudalkalibacillus salsuginis]